MNFNFTITVGELQIPTYRELLYMISPVFKAMLDNDKDCKSIELDENVDEKAITGFFNAILPTKMANAITENNRRGVLSLAFKYDIMGIVDYIEQLEINDIGTRRRLWDLTSVTKFASKFKLHKLQKKIIEEMNKCNYNTLSKLAGLLPNIDKDFAIALGVRAFQLIGNQSYGKWEYQGKI